MLAASAASLPRFKGVVEVHERGLSCFSFHCAASLRNPKAYVDPDGWWQRVERTWKEENSSFWKEGTDTPCNPRYTPVPTYFDS